MSTRQYVSIVSLRDEQFRKLYMYHLGEMGQWDSRFHRLATVDRLVLLKILLCTESEMVVQWGENIFHIFLEKSRRKWLNIPLPWGKEILNQSRACKCLRILYLWKINISKIGYDCDSDKMSGLIVIRTSLTFAQLESDIWLNLDSLSAIFVKFIGHIVLSCFS